MDNETDLLMYEKSKKKGLKEKTREELENEYLIISDNNNVANEETNRWKESYYLMKGKRDALHSVLTSFQAMTLKNKFDLEDIIEKEAY